MKFGAVIVTYNADAETVEASLTKLESEVSRVFLVDNGSSVPNVNALRAAVKKFSNAVLIENEKNLGIAAGLNVGVKRLLEEGSDWILTLDDDSLVPHGMVADMIAAWNTLSPERRERIGILAPNYSTMKGVTYPYHEPTVVPTAITSGQLVHRNVFNKIGLFKEDLFIEGVDHEFCFRALSRGFDTLLIPRVVLAQRIGNPVLKNFLGKRFIVANHRPFRYYYNFRNSVYLYKTYWWVVPGWTAENIVGNFLVLAKMLILEENKWAKTKMSCKGLIDGLCGRLGMLPVSNMQRL